MVEHKIRNKKDEIRKIRFQVIQLSSFDLSIFEFDFSASVATQTKP